MPKTEVVVPLDFDIRNIPAEEWAWCEHCACHLDHCDCAEQN